MTINKWKLDSVYDHHDTGAAQAMVLHYKKIGWEARTAEGDALEVWVKKPDSK